MEQVPPNFPKIKTVGELIERLKSLDPQLPVSLMIEFEGQYEDSLREVIELNNRVVLMGLERICPEYRRLNPKISD